MVLYSEHVQISLVVIALPVIISLYLFFVKKDTKPALLLAIFSGFLIQCLLAYTDPFLNYWDERFHALVSKNMMSYPFKPMIRVEALLPYDVDAWCCNHIWVHKQPLFLWQIALSLKIFGVHEFFMRLPSVLMGTISMYLIYDIGKMWTRDKTVGYIAGLLFVFAHFQLELLAGRYSLDHNDLAFAFYITISIWSWLRYLESKKKWSWALLTGFFIGCAILIKWLTALLVFGGWGLYILLDPNYRKDIKSWMHISGAAILSLITFLPWQLYIMKAFPKESAAAYLHNEEHIEKVLGNHYGSNWFHLDYMSTIYFDYWWILFIPGLIGLYINKKVSGQITTSMLAMVLVIYAFFSFFVVTKMPAFTLPVHAIIWIILAYGLVLFYRRLEHFEVSKWIFPLLVFGLMIHTFQPSHLIHYLRPDNEKRNRLIHNTSIYKNDALFEPHQDRVILNCVELEFTELMFYQDVNAYNWWPSEHQIDSLADLGYKFSAFKSHHQQILPDYITDDEDIWIIDAELK